ncbi:hypothetical protein [Eremococcus coleocola]|uniref:Uncharacterized protein n=1 Tax=Eremococcus coleocola ACS-139-V-Col8 TaxID=908337 RepID=E4KQK5_9LACT|nr:hypothetical protein [Eremococcus coleocola]EFR30624.1 hypothetical protein HMPREF9257_0563 [Eremococcus coleocola ACS-139-V-Col8]
MAQPRLVIEKEKQAKAIKPVFIDVELLEQIKELKQETGWPIQRITEKFIRYGLENVEVVEE